MLASGKAEAAATYRWIDCRRMNAEPAIELNELYALFRLTHKASAIEIIDQHRGRISATVSTHTTPFILHKYACALKCTQTAQQVTHEFALLRRLRCQVGVGPSRRFSGHVVHVGAGAADPNRIVARQIAFRRPAAAMPAHIASRAMSIS
jgi:hypothetical protein